MGKVLRTVLICGVFICCALMLGRVALAYYYPADMKSALQNETLTLAWHAAGEEAYAYTQKPNTPYDDKEKGHFFFNWFLAVPCAGQVQVTVRYNDSTLDDLKNDFKLDATPPADDPRLTFVLRTQSGSWYPVTQRKNDSTLIYNYSRLVFDGVDLQNGEYLYLDVYFGEADYSKDAPYGSMLIFITEAPTKEYTFSAAELGQ